MQTEIEAKFLNVDFDEVRDKLKSIGAECIQPMRLMRRAVIDYSDRRMQSQKDGWIRVRDEGNKVTLTYKQTTEHEFAGAKEIEVVVSDYQKTIDIFVATGLTVQSTQENKRETWQVGDVEIVLDDWPWLNPYIEIEGPSEYLVKELAGRLGYEWSEAVFGSVTVAYRHQYPNITKIGEKISKIPEIRFNLPQPSWFEGE